MATAFGVFTGALGVISFLLDLVPKKPSDRQVKFRIAVGMDGSAHVPKGKNPLRNAGGDLPDIRVWNEGGTFLGMKADPGRIGHGTTKEVTVGLKYGHQPTYALFTGNNDAICIAYIISSWADRQSYGWVGIWASDCKRSWYYSNMYLDGKQLRCDWIDKDGDLPVAGFQVHFPEFHSNKAKWKGKNYYCNQKPPLKFYYNYDPNKINYWTNAGKRQLEDGLADDLFNYVHEAITDGEDGETPDIDPTEDDLYDEEEYANVTRLVRSSREEHSAIELCESPESRGPDLLSLSEGMFCDMTSRAVWAICGGDEYDCFDQETLEIRISPSSSVKARNNESEEPYTEVVDWY